MGQKFWLKGNGSGIFQSKIDIAYLSPTMAQALIAYSQYEKISNDFDLWISKSWNLEQIKMIEGLLFISMIPLHNEDIKKQLAFYAVGVQRLNEIDFSKI